MLLRLILTLLGMCFSDVFLFVEWISTEGKEYLVMLRFSYALLVSRVNVVYALPTRICCSGPARTPQGFLMTVSLVGFSLGGDWWVWDLNPQFVLKPK